MDNEAQIIIEPKQLNPVVFIFALLFPFIAALSYFSIWPGAESTKLLYTASKIIQFGLPLVVWALRGIKLDQVKKLISENSIFRLKAIDLFQAVGTGLFFLVSGGATYFFVLQKFIKSESVKLAIRQKLSEFGATTPSRFLCLALFMAVIHSFLEEYYWRGFVLSELNKKVSHMTAICIAALGFTLHHIVIVNEYVKVEPRLPFVFLGSFAVFSVGWSWSMQYSKSKNLCVSWISHIFADILVLWIGYDIVFL